MRTTYRYKNLSFPIGDAEEVKFTVKFISDGNEGQTIINIPGDNDPEIPNEGTISLGKGSDLRRENTIAVSDIYNLAVEEDEIRIQYSINGVLLKEHVNNKSDESRPLIILIINFPVKD